MLEILRADITTLDTDAIVNAANEGLRAGGGVCGAIHRAAGPELERECLRLAPCPTGQARLTRGYRLHARYVIHAVGPVWHGGAEGEPALLRRAYQSAFQVGRAEPAIRSIAFPAISTGIYGFPKDLAARIAVEVMKANDPAFDRVVACLFDEESATLYRAALAE